MKSPISQSHAEGGRSLMSYLLTDHFSSELNIAEVHGLPNISGGEGAYAWVWKGMHMPSLHLF